MMCGMKAQHTFAIPESLSGQDIRHTRRRLKMTQAAFASFLGVSKKTIERWEGGKNPVTGPVVPLLKILKEQPYLIEEYTIPEKVYPLRLRYMFRDELCTIIDVDERNRRVKIRNYTNDLQFRAFGKNEHPDFETYEAFLESRCFPHTRDKMKIMLRELDLPFYDPFLIIQKTGGRMAEDDFHILLER